MLFATRKGLGAGADRAMVTLPQNLCRTPGVLYEAFSTTTGWTVTNGTLANNTSEFKEGTQSLKLTAQAAKTVSMVKTINWDLSGVNRISFWVYIHDALADYTGNIGRISIATNSGLNPKLACTLVNRICQPGWNFITCFRYGETDIAFAGTDVWTSNQIRLRFEFTSATGKTPSMSFGGLYVYTSHVPGVAFRFDDGDISQYTACKILLANGIRPLIFQIGNWIDQSYGITTAHLQELDRAGCVIANHTQTHPHLNTLTLAEQQAEIAGCTATLAAIGITRGSQVFCPPYGDGDINADTYTAAVNLGMTHIVTAGKGHIYRACSLPKMLPMTQPFFGGEWTTLTTPIATLLSYVDNAILGQYIVPFYGHVIGAGGDISIADFTTLAEYIGAKKKAGLIYDITADDMYKLQTNAIRIPR
jgi:hypothetical protein